MGIALTQLIHVIRQECVWSLPKRQRWRRCLRTISKKDTPCVVSPNIGGELGVRGPRGNSYWSDGTIHHILTNPVYIATVSEGRNHYRPATGRISPLNPVGGGIGSLDPVPPEEWIVVAQIPAIVSQEQFEVIQEKLKHNQSIASRNNKAHQYLLRAMRSPWAVSLGVYRTYDRYGARLLRL